MVSPLQALLLPLLLLAVPHSAEVRVRRDLLSDLLVGLGRVRGRPGPRRHPVPPNSRRRPPRHQPHTLPFRTLNPRTQRRPKINQPKQNQLGPINSQLRSKTRPQNNDAGLPSQHPKLIYVDQPLSSENPAIKEIPITSEVEDLVHVNNIEQSQPVGHRDELSSRFDDTAVTPSPLSRYQTSFTSRTSQADEVESDQPNYSSLLFLEAAKASQGFAPDISSPFSSEPRSPRRPSPRLSSQLSSVPGSRHMG